MPLSSEINVWTVFDFADFAFHRLTLTYSEFNESDLKQTEVFWSIGPGSDFIFLVLVADSSIDRYIILNTLFINDDLIPSSFSGLAI